MPLSKNEPGNMYDWVTHKLSIVQGECPHKCDYCYVKRGRAGGLPAYKGEPRLNEKDLKLNLGSGKTIFVCHMSDLFASGVQEGIADKVLELCRKYPDNTYVFQTKHPLGVMWTGLPPKYFFGTTIETDSDALIAKHSKAPVPMQRALGLNMLKQLAVPEPLQTFVTIEPIMRFDLDGMLNVLKEARPDWINIGADSKGCNLPEPTWDEVQDLVKGIRDLGIEIREKSNLDRLRRLD